MKDTYFTPDSIDADARTIQNELLDYQARRPFRIDPEDAALIVLDMQRYFLDPESHAFIPSAEAIVPGILQLVQMFQELELPVLFTRHTNTPQNAGPMEKWWHYTIKREDPMSELIPVFAELEPDILEKEQYDAFYNTDLEEWLREQDIKQLIIGGVMTHLCCETTARSAFIRGFEVFFLIDGTATYTIDFHKSSLLTLSHGFAHPVRVKEVADRLQQILGLEVEEEDEDTLDIEEIREELQHQ